MHWSSFGGGGAAMNPQSCLASIAFDNGFNIKFKRSGTASRIREISAVANATGGIFPKLMNGEVAV